MTRQSLLQFLFFHFGASDMGYHIWTLVESFLGSNAIVDPTNDHTFDCTGPWMVDWLDK